MRIRYAGRLWDVSLEDDGTLDTVISVRPAAWRRGDTILYSHVAPDEIEVPYAIASNWHCSRCGLPTTEATNKPCTSPITHWQETRFDSEYASNYRRPNGEMTMRGLRILGQEAAEQYDLVRLAEEGAAGGYVVSDLTIKTGTEWVDVGQGSAVRELFIAFAAGPFTNVLRVDKFLGEALGYAKGATPTNLRLTGAPITEEDWKRLESAQFRVGE